MAQNVLDCLVRYAQAIQVRSQTPAECVPAAPMRGERITLEIVACLAVIALAYPA